MDLYPDLTARQKSVLAMIIDHQKKNGMAPTVRDIAAYLGLRSPGGIHRILNVLKNKGYIVAEPGKKRAWCPLQDSPVGGIPVLGRIAAGEPIEAIENAEEMLGFQPSVFGCDACYALWVKGDSMIECHIMPGDLAIIKPQQQVQNGEIAAVLVRDMLSEATLKIVRRYKKSIKLIAANQAYEPLVFREKEMQRISIIGKLVGVVRRI